jgi:hypothetical protein
MEFTKAEVTRFESKVVKSESGCWEWSGSKFNAGYGIFCMAGRGRKTFAAHRISWMMNSGQDIPPKMMICHKCDNRGCVNPDHLYLGTGRDNNMDTVSRGRGNRVVGSACPWSKVTEQDVMKIHAHTGPQTELAKELGISTSQVSHIKSGRRWPHIFKLLQNG